MLTRTGLAISLALMLSFPLQAKVSAAEAASLKDKLTPMGAERAGNASGSIPKWEGGLVMERPAAGKERSPASYAAITNDKPTLSITAANLEQHRDKLTPGAIALLQKYSDTYKMNVYPTRRTGNAPDFVYEATAKNAVNASLENDGESLVGAVVGIPFPIPKSGKEIIWNHKVRYRGEGLQRWNIQLAVHTNGSFVPYKIREDVRFHYNFRNATPESLQNVIIYFLQFTTAPARQAGNVLLVHETMDQVKEARRAWLYNPGQRRIRRAPNVAYDNPGTGADGLRTNDQLDSFNGASDRYVWNIVGKKEMYLPYNGYKLWDSAVSYKDIALRGHMNQDLARYELRRVWVLDSTLKAGTTHQYKRRTYYVDEDTWTVLAVDIYDGRDELWRVQEYHPVMQPWLKAVGPAGATVYDLQANRYLLMELSNEEPMFEEVDWSTEHFTTGSVQRMATK
jgi:hypothetical protein